MKVTDEFKRKSLTFFAVAIKQDYDLRQANQDIRLQLEIKREKKEGR